MARRRSRIGSRCSTGVKPARDWIEAGKPDVVIVVYNDHASRFGLDMTPTFAIGVGDEFAPHDEGYGPRPVPTCQGDPAFAWHLVESLVLKDEFDMAIVSEMSVRPWPDGAAIADVWPTGTVALSRDSVMRQRHPVSAAGRRCAASSSGRRFAAPSTRTDLTSRWRCLGRAGCRTSCRVNARD